MTVFAQSLTVTFFIEADNADEAVDMIDDYIGRDMERIMSEIDTLGLPVRFATSQVTAEDDHPCMTCNSDDCICDDEPVGECAACHKLIYDDSLMTFCENCGLELIITPVE